MASNRQGQAAFTGNIETLVEHDKVFEITYTGGMSFMVSKEELNGFVPQVGDFMVLYTTQFSIIQGIIIEGTVVRYRTAEEVEQNRLDWIAERRLEKEKRYALNKEKMAARVANLHPALRARMERFGAEHGEDFWIEDADYEMAAVEGADALLKKTEALFPDAKQMVGRKIHYVPQTSARLNWINDWWNLNTKEQGYNYKKQMEMVPDFGDGHSGNTAGAAKGLAVAVLRGQAV